MGHNRLFFDGFFQDFEKTFKKKTIFPPRIDELGRIFAWPLVFLLAKTPARPEFLILCSFLCGILASFALALRWFDPGWIVLFILLRFTFDCADGGLARYSRRESNLGGLLDVNSDFICTVAMFLAIGFDFIVHAHGNPVVISIFVLLALFANLISSTITSYVSFCATFPSFSFKKTKELFTNGQTNDHATDPRYTTNFLAQKRLYNFTWKPVTQCVFSLPIWRSTSPKPSVYVEHLYGLAGPGAHLIFLAGVIACGVSFWWFFTYQFAVLSLVIGLSTRPTKLFRSPVASVSAGVRLR